MYSLILSTATRALVPLMLLFSVFILIRGHNEPGGGFVGGLVAATAFVLYAMGYDVAKARFALRVDPRTLITWGLALAAGAGLIGLLEGDPFLTGQWLPLPIPVLGKLGTPVMFDLGVYFVVLGVVLTMVFALAEEVEGR
jgi:multicomponent Na+:H+ antiporter subunit B